MNVKEVNIANIFPAFKSLNTRITRKNPVYKKLPIVGVYPQSDTLPVEFDVFNEGFMETIQGESKRDSKVSYLLIQLTEQIIWDATTKNCAYLIRMAGGLSHLGIAGVASRELSRVVPGVFPFFFQTRHEEPAIIANTISYFDDGRSRFSTFAEIVGAGFVTFFGEKVYIYGKSRTFPIDYEHQRQFYLGTTCHEFCKDIFSTLLPDFEITAINNNVESRGVKLPDPVEGQSAE